MRTPRFVVHFFCTPETLCARNVLTLDGLQASAEAVNGHVERLCISDQYEFEFNLIGYGILVVFVVELILRSISRG